MEKAMFSPKEHGHPRTSIEHKTLSAGTKFATGKTRELESRAPVRSKVIRADAREQFHDKYPKAPMSSATYPAPKEPSQTGPPECKLSHIAP